MSFFGRRPTGSAASSLVAFYEGTGRDHRGRRLSEILKWGADRLEASHDYIQTVFPLPEASGMNWDAPIIDRQVFDAFRSRTELRGRLRDSFQKILWFYGFKLDYEDGQVKISRGDNYGEHSGNWNNRFDHNHLRITRIIRCLRVLGLEDEGKAFRTALESAATRVDSRSREFWRRAAERALNLRPDLEIYDENDTTVGPKFLREFEVERKAKLAAATHDTQEPDEAPTEQSGEKQENKEVVEVNEVSDEANKVELETPVKNIEEQEWTGFPEDSPASKNSDQSGPKQSKDAEIAENDEKWE